MFNWSDKKTRYNNINNDNNNFSVIFFKYFFPHPKLYGCCNKYHNLFFDKCEVKFGYCDSPGINVPAYNLVSYRMAMIQDVAQVQYQLEGLWFHLWLLHFVCQHILVPFWGVFFSFIDSYSEEMTGKWREREREGK